MKLTQSNASKLYDGLCMLLGIDSLFIDYNGILHLNYTDEEDEYIVLYSSVLPGIFIPVELYGSKIWKEYNNQIAWSISGLISVDDFAYHMRCDPNKVKYQILKIIMQSTSNKGIMIKMDDKNYVINSLEELKIKSDLKT